MMATKAAKIEKIYNYVYEGTNKQGNRVKGELSGGSTSKVKSELRRQGITPIKVIQKSNALTWTHRTSVTPKDIALFSRQIATMMKSGVPLVQSFEIIGRGSSNPKVQDLMLKIKNDVESGTALADALAKFPEYFDELYCSLVAAGEQSGTLEQMLDRIALYKEKTEALKGKIKKASFYPTSVIVVAAVVTGVLLIFVVPKFEDLFQSFGADLPVFTQMVVSLSRWMQQYWFFLLLGVAGCFWGLSELKQRNLRFQHFIDRTILRLPILGSILHKAAIARYARTLSTTFSAGVPLLEALDSVASASGNIVYKEAIQAIRNDIAIGQQMQLAMRTTHLFPNMVIQMVAIGEESGSLDDMLSKVAHFYEEEVDNLVDGLSSLIEPMIMVILGILIGGLIMAMYLPIFKIGSVV